MVALFLALNQSFINSLNLSIVQLKNNVSSLILNIKQTPLKLFLRATTLQR